MSVQCAIWCTKQRVVHKVFINLCLSWTDSSSFYQNHTTWKEIRSVFFDNRATVVRFSFGVTRAIITLFQGNDQGTLTLSVAANVDIQSSDSCWCSNQSSWPLKTPKIKRRRQIYSKLFKPPAAVERASEKIPKLRNRMSDMARVSCLPQLGQGSQSCFSFFATASWLFVRKKWQTPFCSLRQRQRFTHNSDNTHPRGFLRLSRPDQYFQRLPRHLATCDLSNTSTSPPRRRHSLSTSQQNLNGCSTKELR